MVTAWPGDTQRVNPAEAWLEWPSEPRGDRVRWFSSRQLTANEQDEEESHADPAAPGVLYLPLPSHTLHSRLNLCLIFFSPEETLLVFCFPDHQV